MATLTLQFQMSNGATTIVNATEVISDVAELENVIKRSVPGWVAAAEAFLLAQPQVPEGVAGVFMKEPPTPQPTNHDVTEPANG